MEKVPMTAEGYAILENELKHRLQVERPCIIQRITDARLHDGDLAENAEYHFAKDSQARTRPASRNSRISSLAPISSMFRSCLERR
jgi:transcription elongation GreA/GreB family factor